MTIMLFTAYPIMQDNCIGVGYCMHTNFEVFQFMDTTNPTFS